MNRNAAARIAQLAPSLAEMMAHKFVAPMSQDRRIPVNRKTNMRLRYKRRLVRYSLTGHDRSREAYTFRPDSGRRPKGKVDEMETNPHRTSPAVKLLAILIGIFVIGLFLRTCFGPAL